MRGSPSGGGPFLVPMNFLENLGTGLIRSHVDGGFFPIDPPDPFVMESHRKRR